jgi:hypothetical protein
MNRTPPKPRPFIHIGCYHPSELPERRMRARADARVTRSFRTFWSEEDGAFVGLCDQFPSVSHIASTGAAALNGIRNLVAQIDEGEA